MRPDVLGEEEFLGPWRISCSDQLVDTLDKTTWGGMRCETCVIWSVDTTTGVSFYLLSQSYSPSVVYKSQSFTICFLLNLPKKTIFSKVWKYLRGLSYKTKGRRSIFLKTRCQLKCKILGHFHQFLKFYFLHILSF